MHIRHAEGRHAQAAYECARHCEGETQIALRRKASLEVAAVAEATKVNLRSVNTTNAVVPAHAATEPGTYEMSALRRQKGDLSILTQDGDKVQIRFRSSQGVAAQSSTNATADSSTSTTSIYAFAAGRVRVAVEGELDADELKAIGDLMEKVDALATEFFDGDAQAAFSAAASLGFDSSEIAGFALRLSVKESLRATAAPPAPASPPAATQALPAEAPPAELPPAVPTPVTAAPEPIVESAPSPDPTPIEPPNVASAEVPAVVEPAASSPAPAIDPLATLQQSLGSFLKQVLDTLASVKGSGRAEFSMRWKLEVMIAAVESLPAATQADSAGTKLATDSLADLQGQGLVATPVGEGAVVNSDVRNA